MALDTYTNLKTAIAAALPRADMTATIPDFILMAEAEFNRKLRTLNQETRANLTISGEYVTRPNDFLEFRSGYTISTPRRALHYLSSDTQTTRYDSSDVSVSGPIYFSMAGDSFRFAPTPATIDAYILYYAKIPPLALNATNWLLTAHPDLYKYASVFYGAVEAQDERLAGAMKSLYEPIIDEVNGASRRSRWGGPAMYARAG